MPAADAEQAYATNSLIIKPLSANKSNNQSAAESPLGELSAADLSCSCRKEYTPAAVLTQEILQRYSLQDYET